MRIAAIIFHFSHGDGLNKLSHTGMLCPFGELQNNSLYFCDIFITVLSVGNHYNFK